MKIKKTGRGCGNPGVSPPPQGVGRQGEGTERILGQVILGTHASIEGNIEAGTEGETQTDTVEDTQAGTGWNT